MMTLIVVRGFDTPGAERLITLTAASHFQQNG